MAKPADPAGAGAGLLLCHGGRQWRFAPGAVVTVGRDLGCDVVLDDPRLSRRHLVIADRDGWRVEDPGSRNGSWLGGQRVRSAPVDGPLELRLGDRAGPLLTVEPDRAAGRPEPRSRPAPVTAPVTTPVTATRPGPASVSIGRARDNDIVLNDVLVSRHHARVEATAAGRQVVDLGSRNRTLVNGSPVDAARPLVDGDRLTIGGTEFRVEDGELRPTAVATRRLVAADLSYRLPGGAAIVSGVSFDLGVGELVAVIGPSGAGKSTLLKLLTGQLRPAAGTASYDGYDMYEQFDAVRPLIGVVPQDDVVHRLLTVDQALTYAARLRLPDDTGAAERRAAVAAVLAELGLTGHARTRVDRLSGGQRKRVSIALELLTSPSLLLLDEPTSGLDPALEQQLMDTLRALADAGRTVVVVTHNPAQLGRCDRVLLLAPGGVLVYAGRPSGVLPHFGGGDWAEVYGRLIDDPELARRSQAGAGGRAGRPEVPPARRTAAAVRPAGWPTRLRQARTLAARHLALIRADRGYAAFLLLLPALLAGLALAVPGHAGLRAAGPEAPGEAGQLLVLMFVGAAFAGGAIAAREVIGERSVLLRDRAAGLHPSAYALAKLAVFAGLCAAQAAVLTAGVALVKPLPPVGVLAGSGRLELAAAAWATALASAQFSLLCSALARSAEQVMPLLVVTVMAQLVLCGGLIPVTGRPGISELSWLAPARWGYAAGAATADLRRIAPGGPADPLWAHSAAWWLLSAAVLVAATAGSTALLSLRIGRLDRT